MANIGHGVKTDLIGQVVGRLTVTKLLSERNKSGTLLYECICKCGNIHKATRASLRAGNCQSCGCLSKERKVQNGIKATANLNKKNGFSHGVNVLYNHYKSKAKFRKYTFDLSHEQFLALIMGHCYYCNNAPNTTRNFTLSGEVIVYNGIDRVDNSQGYTTGNVVPCCRICNQAKSTMAVDDFFQWVMQIYKHNNLDRKNPHDQKTQ